MKIAIIAGYNDSDLSGWTKAFAFSDCFECLGHSVNIFNLYNILDDGSFDRYTDDNLKDFIDQQENFDFVLLLDAWNFSSPLYAHINIPSIIETGNDPMSIQQNLSKVQYFDLICSPDKQCVEIYKLHGLNAYWFKPWVDINVHKPDGVKDKLVVGITEHWGGEGISHFMRTKLGDLWIDDEPNTRYDLNKLLSRAKIVFCHSVYGNIINLIFEAAACNCMVLTNHIDRYSGIYDLFFDNYDIMYYYTWKEAVNKILLLKDNENRINKIACHGYNKILQYHTLDCRINEILDLVEKI